MPRLWFIFALLFAAPAAAESLGNLAQYPPSKIDLTITTADDAMPKIEPAEIKLLSGRYYRLTINCPDVRDDLSGWRIEMRQLLNNSHLRLVTVGDIEVHLQGLSFNAIECDEIGAAHVSFVPIKPGTFPFYVGNVPLAVGRPIGESGVQAKGKSVFGKFVVQ
ncbi:MAG TPA: hypothetical protein DEQ83_04165 [Rhodobiaceae bacterium]|jgi:hypothetical protein|nr:hypothetical protein [Rhodobiaceae bacterium]|tara:strand:- start:232 stop:720 length:489 start_codon:yes stop_codon:yes gene_type:complete